MPVSPVPFDPKWTHLSDLQFADPEFGIPGRVEILLGVNVFTDGLLQGHRKGLLGSPAAMETLFGWVLCGNTEPTTYTTTSFTVCHASVNTGDNLIQRFWEIEEPPVTQITNQWRNVSLRNILRTIIRTSLMDDL